MVEERGSPLLINHGAVVESHFGEARNGHCGRNCNYESCFSTCQSTSKRPKCTITLCAASQVSQMAHDPLLSKDEEKRQCHCCLLTRVQASRIIAAHLILAFLCTALIVSMVHVRRWSQGDLSATNDCQDSVFVKPFSCRRPRAITFVV